MSGITTRLCGLRCLKVQLMVPPSMPVSSSKVQGKRENREGGVKGMEVWKRVVVSADTESWDFQRIRDSDKKGTVKGPLVLPLTKKGGTLLVGLGGREEGKVASYINKKIGH